MIIARLLAGRGTKTYQTVTGKGFRPRPLDLGKWRPVVGAGILVYFFATVVGPLLVLVYASLLPYYQAPSIEAFAVVHPRQLPPGVRDGLGRPGAGEQPDPRHQRRGASSWR